MGQKVFEGQATCPEQCRRILSKMLQMTMCSKEAFVKAVEQGMVVLSDDGGHLVWTLENKTMLAYLLGRMYSGDSCRYNKKKRGLVWIKGKRPFPGAELGRVFGVTTLRNLRERRFGKLLPENFYLVDNLFDNAD